MKAFLSCTTTVMQYNFLEHRLLYLGEMGGRRERPGGNPESRETADMHEQLDDLRQRVSREHQTGLRIAWSLLLGRQNEQLPMEPMQNLQFSLNALNVLSQRNDADALRAIQEFVAQFERNAPQGLTFERTTDGTFYFTYRGEQITSAPREEVNQPAGIARARFLWSRIILDGPSQENVASLQREIAGITDEEALRNLFRTMEAAGSGGRFRGEDGNAVSFSMDGSQLNVQFEAAQE